MKTVIWWEGMTILIVEDLNLLRGIFLVEEMRLAVP